MFYVINMLKRNCSRLTELPPCKIGFLLMRSYSKTCISYRITTYCWMIINSQLVIFNICHPMLNLRSSICSLCLHVIYITLDTVKKKSLFVTTFSILRQIFLSQSCFLVLSHVLKFPTHFATNDIMSAEVL